MEGQIFEMIKFIVASKLNRVSVTWEEVESLYESNQRPDINADIDYILGGK